MGFVQSIPLKMRALLTAVLLIDMKEYLPSVTKQWCQDKLAELGFSDGKVSSTKFDFNVQLRDHEVAYHKLRLALQQYLQTSGQTLEETPPPYGGVGWKPIVNQVVEDAYNGRLAEPHAPGQMDFPDDGPDQGAEPEDFDEEVVED